MADENVAVPDVDGMDDKTFDAFKSGLMSGEMPASNPATQTNQQPQQQASDPAQQQSAQLAGDDDDDGPQKQESVPFGRFERERQRRKEAEANADKRINETRSEYERRIEALISQVSRPQQQEQPKPVPAEPDENDPVALINYLRDEVKALKGDREQRVQQSQQQTQARQIMEYAQNEFANATKADPSLNDAYNFLKESMVREAQAYGLQGPAIREFFDNAEFQQINYAVQSRRPIGEHVRALAMARGWTPQQAQAAQQQANPAANPAPAPAPDMDKIQRQAATLTHSGGSPARTGIPSPQELLDMSPKEFDEWRSKNDLSRAFAVN